MAPQPVTKEDVLETAQDMLRKGLVEGTSGNVSGRLADGRICLTPSSVAYEVGSVPSATSECSSGRRCSSES